MNKNLLIITGIVATVVILLMVWMFTGGPAAKKSVESIDLKLIKEYADELVNFRLYEQAIDQYESYLDSPSLSPKKRAHLNYLIGNIYMENLGDYERAIGRYLKAKIVEPETELISDIDRKIIECLERLGRSADAARLMSQTTDIEAGGSGESAQAAEGDDIVVARLGDRKITMGEVRSEIEKLPPEFRAQMKDTSRMLDFLSKYVTSELLYEAAIRRGFDKDSDVIDMANRAKKQLMVERLYEDEVLKKIDISEQDLKLFYRANKEKFTLPERAEVSHILLSDEADAKKAFDMLSDGEDFSAVCADMSIDERTKANNGYLGVVTRDGFVAGMGNNKAFASAVFELQPGEFSKPIHTDAGWHIVKMNKKYPEELQPYEKIKNQVYYQMRREKEQLKFDELTNSLGKDQGIEIFDEAVEEITKNNQPEEDGQEQEAPQEPEKNNDQ